mmetsp:Transcript_51990/g.137587  ORF Transcript_51990/g.137587 Transcript_51990/m.137587 type:complete len:297 (+) Transcript_51990:1408-2298(+)
MRRTLHLDGCHNLQLRPSARPFVPKNRQTLHSVSSICAGKIHKKQQGAKLLLHQPQERSSLPSDEGHCFRGYLHNSEVIGRTVWQSDRANPLCLNQPHISQRFRTSGFCACDFQLASPNLKTSPRYVSNLALGAALGSHQKSGVLITDSDRDRLTSMLTLSSVSFALRLATAVILLPRPIAIATEITTLTPLAFSGIGFCLHQPVYCAFGHASACNGAKNQQRLGIIVVAIQFSFDETESPCLILDGMQGRPLVACDVSNRIVVHHHAAAILARCEIHVNRPRLLLQQPTKILSSP